MTNWTRILTILALLTTFTLATNSTGGDFYLKLKKCRYCKMGTTHSLMMFLKYDKGKFDKFDLRLSFQIEDGSGPQIAKVDLEGNELDTTPIDGMNLKQLREVIFNYGIQPKEALRDADFLEDQWKAHLKAKNIDYSQHDL